MNLQKANKTELRTEIVGLREDRIYLRNRITKLDNVVEAQVNSHEELTSNIVALEAKITTLENDKKNLEESLEGANYTANIMKTENNEFIQSVEELNFIVEERCRDIENLRTDLSHSASRVKGLEHDININNEVSEQLKSLILGGLARR